MTTTQLQQCWYCSRDPGDGAHVDRVSVYGNVARGPDGTIAFQTATVEIPRCRRCAKAHGREMIMAVMLFLVGGLVGVLVYALISEWLARVIGWGLFVGILFVGFGAAGGAPVGVGSQRLSAAARLARQGLEGWVPTEQGRSSCYLTILVDVAAGRLLAGSGNPGALGLAAGKIADVFTGRRAGKLWKTAFAAAR